MLCFLRRSSFTVASFASVMPSLRFDETDAKEAKMLNNFFGFLCFFSSCILAHFLLILCSLVCILFSSFFFCKVKIQSSRLSEERRNQCEDKKKKQKKLYYSSIFSFFILKMIFVKTKIHFKQIK
uniref:Uncharacterized protein n=1 Tax=Pediastrum duplex TaxID=3105 RepID=A0A2U8GIR4_PEDDU|nr:hypothetical protein [Pediastrum duplex]